jgi:hypothetical protein
LRCDAPVERSSNAAEFTAPQETTNSRASTRWISLARSTSTAWTLRPGPSAISRRASAPVHSVTVGCNMAGRMPQISASLFACSLHGNELQVSHSTQPSCSRGRISPSGSAEGCSPWPRSRSTIAAISGECSIGG